MVDRTLTLGLGAKVLEDVPLTPSWDRLLSERELEDVEGCYEGSLAELNYSPAGGVAELNETFRAPPRALSSNPRVFSLSTDVLNNLSPVALDGEATPLPAYMSAPLQVPLPCHSTPLTSLAVSLGSLSSLPPLQDSQDLEAQLRLGITETAPVARILPSSGLAKKVTGTKPKLPQKMLVSSKAGVLHPLVPLCKSSSTTWSRDDKVKQAPSEVAKNARGEQVATAGPRTTARRKEKVNQGSGVQRPLVSGRVEGEKKNAACDRTTGQVGRLYSCSGGSKSGAVEQARRLSSSSVGSKIGGVCEVGQARRLSSSSVGVKNGDKASAGTVGQAKRLSSSSVGSRSNSKYQSKVMDVKRRMSSASDKSFGMNGSRSKELNKPNSVKSLNNTKVTNTTKSLNTTKSMNPTKSLNSTLSMKTNKLMNNTKTAPAPNKAMTRVGGSVNCSSSPRKVATTIGRERPTGTRPKMPQAPRVTAAANSRFLKPLIQEQVVKAPSGVEKGRREASRLARCVEALAVVVGWQQAEAEARERRLLQEEGRKREAEELLEVSREKHARSEGAVQELRTRLGWDIEKMVKKHEEEVRAVREAARCAERATRLEVEGRVREVEERHKAKLAREMEQCEVAEQVVSSISTENMALRTQVNQLEAKVSALVVSVMQGSDPRDSTIGGLQQEVASLGVVLELRTKELREIQRERRAQENKDGELKMTKEKVRTLETRVEDLKAQVIVKKSSEQSLEAEMERLQSSLKKTSLEKRRLSMENELLEWKVREATPPASTSRERTVCGRTQERMSPMSKLYIQPFLSRLRRSSTDLRLLDNTLELGLLDNTLELVEAEGREGRPRGEAELYPRH